MQAVLSDLYQATQGGISARAFWDNGRGLHSSTFWLNVSVFCVMGGAFRGRFRGVSQVLLGI